MDFASQFQGVLTRALLSLFLLRFSFSLSLSLFLFPSVFLSPSVSLLPSFLLQVVTTRSSGDALRKNRPFQPSPCVFYVREISQEFAYVQMTSRWFEISHRQICLRQPYLFRPSALQPRHVRARFECPGTLRPLPSHIRVYVCVCMCIYRAGKSTTVPSPSKLKLRFHRRLRIRREIKSNGPQPRIRRLGTTSTQTSVKSLQCQQKVQ